MLICPKCGSQSLKVVRTLVVEVPFEDDDVISHKKTLLKATTKVIGVGSKKKWRCQSCHHVFE